MLLALTSATQIAQQTRRHRGSGQKQVVLIGKFLKQFR
jgi:hypothetical protein